ncbi:MAG: DUF2336 domain-containing protein [Hyphomonadaceae bacterium]|jgi:uncharacterized protein (DUF2336 family)|uniref:DUF2336 domain-containing protein n=1 Tax=Aquidulcibacter sp. TaxID=2052990 RepID=UPI00261D5128|nr:DUF2336 domain-containing protein [Aquidulcibacter sp.]
MSNKSTHHPLITLAENSSRESREALVAATAAQFLNTGDEASLMERTLFSDILVKLYNFARQEVRLKLSATLAMADWAPIELVRELAMDSFDIAQPILAFCPILNDDILVEVVKACGFDHRMTIAERPCIGEIVTHGLIETEDKKILSTLATNVTARIAANDFERAMNVLSDVPDSLNALVSRHDLPPSLIAAAFAIAGAEARDAITSRVSPRLASRLMNTVAETTAEIAKDVTKNLFHHPMPERVAETVRKTARNMDVKPTPGFLVAALMRGEREQFVRGIARILELPVAGVGRKLVSAETESIALAARAANFDSSIVRTIYETLETRSIPWSIGDDRTVALVWMRCSPGAARTAFAKGMTN